MYLWPQFRSQLRCALAAETECGQVNSKRTRVHASPSNNTFVILHSSGLLWSSHRLKIKAPCRLDLALFPFDRITCPQPPCPFPTLIRARGIRAGLMEFESYSLGCK